MLILNAYIESVMFKYILLFLIIIRVRCKHKLKLEIKITINVPYTCIIYIIRTY
jgi:hypothetical protein